MAVYALIVGINTYQAISVRPLNGCVNDAAAVEAFLRGRVTTDLQTKVLLNADATRDAVIATFRSHFGQAGPGDVALFWYSGHGSQQITPPGFWFLEPTGFNSTIVCADSRTKGVPDLADKELSVLIDEVAARGTHMALVLDSCHSGGGTRDPGVAYRGVEPSKETPKLADFLPELAARAPAAPPQGNTRDADDPITNSASLPVADHVALSACRSFEKAKEQPIDGEMRGVFTASLLGALKTLGAGATYRELLSAARCRVENSAQDQVPVLFPVDLAGIGDQPFLGGSVSRPPTTFFLRHVRGAWEVDAGLVHGVPAVAGADTVVLAVAKGRSVDAGHVVRVTEVRADSSVVVPDGWTPDTARQYPVVVKSVPLPPAAVVVGGLDGDDEEALKLVKQALATAAPGGGPSRHVRVVEPTDTSPGLRLRVSTIGPEGAGGPMYRILRGDVPTTPDVAGHSAASAKVVVAQLEHVAQWNQIKALENPASALAGAVKLEIILAKPEDVTAPADRPALVPDGRGEIRLAYSRTEKGLEPPRVFVRIHNTSDRMLWCVLLDLTDRYGISPGLFPGDFVESNSVGAAKQGKSIPVKLPGSRAVQSGASVRDWLKLIVSEEEFGSSGYALPALGEPPATRSAGPRPRGVLARLGRAAIQRDMGDEDDDEVAGDWATSIVPIVTVVPE